MLLRSIPAVLTPALLLLVSAGRWAWPQAWAFLGLYVSCSLATGLWLRWSDPELLAERMKSPFSADQRARDRIVMMALVGAFAAALVLIGLDARFGWSDVALWAQVIGAVMFVAAFAGWVLVLRANRFASVTVRVQRERGQTVISSGPYAVVRHPMYSFALLLWFGTSLLLGSLVGLLGVGLVLPVLAIRALGEEAVLIDGLPGYRAYVAKVRFRLLPGIW